MQAAKRKASAMDVDAVDGADAEDEGIAALAQQAEERERDFERKRKKKAKLDGSDLKGNASAESTSSTNISIL
jgi:hypothetical protein